MNDQKLLNDILKLQQESNQLYKNGQFQESALMMKKAVILIGNKYRVPSGSIKENSSNYVIKAEWEEKSGDFKSAQDDYEKALDTRISLFKRRFDVDKKSTDLSICLSSAKKHIDSESFEGAKDILKHGIEYLGEDYYINQKPFDDITDKEVKDASDKETKEFYKGCSDLLFRVLSYRYKQFCLLHSIKPTI
jgi:tetratricopeptide (TPR) repeat protein